MRWPLAVTVPLFLVATFLTDTAGVSGERPPRERRLPPGPVSPPPHPRIVVKASDWASDAEQKALEEEQRNHAKVQIRGVMRKESSGSHSHAHTYLRVAFAKLSWPVWASGKHAEEYSGKLVMIAGRVEKRRVGAFDGGPVLVFDTISLVHDPEDERSYAKVEIRGRLKKQEVASLVDRYLVYSIDVAGLSWPLDFSGNKALREAADQSAEKTVIVVGDIQGRVEPGSRHFQPVVVVESFKDAK